MENEVPDLLEDVARYYDAKFAEHGETPQGVDWNSEEGQLLRFEQLCKVITQSGGFSVNDLGCGYGALCGFLSERYLDVTYQGFDVSEAMVDAAQKRYMGLDAAHFTVASAPKQVADFGFASGIFNVRIGRAKSAWREYVEATLDSLDRSCTRGFAFNCLTSYSDADRMRDDLYYAVPADLFDLCKQRYSRHVALIHDYGLYEFTILVRKIL